MKRAKREAFLSSCFPIKRISPTPFKENHHPLRNFFWTTKHWGEVKITLYSYKEKNKKGEAVGEPNFWKEEKYFPFIAFPNKNGAL